MRSGIISKSVSTIFIIAVAFAISAFAQTELGRISGRVVDPNGAVVPGATVKVTNVGTNETRTVTANDEGLYVVPALRAAVYKIEGSAASFAVKTITGVQIAVGQQLDLDVPLSPDTQTVTVDVTDATEVGIDTSSARIGATVNQREVHDLPLNGRQLSQLYLQAPGSVNSGSGTFSDIRFSGRAVQQNVVRYDGVEGTAIIDASPGNLNGEVPSKFRLQSSLENVQEFKVDSSNFPAELGTGTGGQISVVTKSGTNEFHGSLFEYVRNDAFDARNFFDNIQSGIPKSQLRLNQFGGSFGGRIIKDKLFFFGSYEGYRVTTGLNFVEAAPSLSLAAPGALIPGTATPVNPAIQPFIQGFRSPNAVTIPGSQTAGFDIVQLQDTAKVKEDAYSLRLDYHANTNNNLYFRFFRDNGTDTSPEGVSGRVVKIEAEPQNGVFGWTSIINQNLLNDFRLGYNGARTRINGQAPTVNGLDFSALTLNISGSVAISGIAGQGTSSGISIPGGLVRANSATNGRGQPYTPYSYSFIDSLSWTKGNHNIKFGGEVRFIRLYTDRLGGTTYTFSNLAGFLANTPQSVQYVGDLSSQSPFTGVTGERLAKQEYYIGYGQDEWKIKPGLTLSYGLRYEYYTPLREQNNGQVLFNIDNGTLRDPSEPAYKSSKNNWGPRVAVTWSPNVGGTGFFGGGKTVFRGGMGYYYGPGQTEDQIQPIESDRIQTTITSGGLLAFPANIPGIVANFNSNPLNRQYQPRAYATDYRIPERILQYSASYQQELPGKFVTTIAYVGSKGNNLFLRSVANQILPGATTITNGANLPTGFGVINRVDPVSGRVVGVNTVRQFDILSGTTQNRPFAEVDYKTSGGDDRYDALQASLSRRASNGITLNAQYTYGFSRGNTAGSNEARTSAGLNDFELDRGRNNFDVRHTFNVSAVYELPIGKGKSFDLGNSVANYVLGDWEVGGILNARSGLPIEVLVVRPDVVIQCTNPSAGCTAGQVLPLPGTINAATPLPAGFTAVVNTPGGGASRNVRRPNVTGQPFYLDNDRNILNPAAFSIPLPGQFGDLPRNALRGPIFRQFDLILSKKFKLTETVNLQFRSEIFNIFNTTNFANPSATLNNALSATFQPGTAFTQSLAGATFGQVRQTVERTVGLGTNRQIQFALRLNF
ncbi:MAG TPA: TonB-dependent receptor [Pyrinomonadaceae bacterium]|nr:TonB-dependent receptor [Pyrinomonadaceae bacterium]